MEKMSSCDGEIFVDEVVGLDSLTIKDMIEPSKDVAGKSDDSAMSLLNATGKSADSATALTNCDSLTIKDLVEPSKDVAGKSKSVDSGMPLTNCHTSLPIRWWPCRLLVGDLGSPPVIKTDNWNWIMDAAKVKEKATWILDGSAYVVLPYVVAKHIRPFFLGTDSPASVPQNVSTSHKQQFSMMMIFPEPVEFCTPSNVNGDFTSPSGDPMLRILSTVKTSLQSMPVEKILIMPVFFGSRANQDVFWGCTFVGLKSEYSAYVPLFPNPQDSSSVVSLDLWFGLAADTIWSLRKRQVVEPSTSTVKGKKQKKTKNIGKNGTETNGFSSRLN